MSDIFEVKGLMPHGDVVKREYFAVSAKAAREAIRSIFQGSQGRNRARIAFKRMCAAGHQIDSIEIDFVRAGLSRS